MLRVFFDEKVERIDGRHLGDQVHLDTQLAAPLWEHIPGEIVPVRILLPVEEVILGRDPQRVADDRRAAMRGGPQPHHMGQELDRPVVRIFRDVVERNTNGHESLSAGQIIENRVNPVCRPPKCSDFGEDLMNRPSTPEFGREMPNPARWPSEKYSMAF